MKPEIEYIHRRRLVFEIFRTVNWVFVVRLLYPFLHLFLVSLGMRSHYETPQSNVSGPVAVMLQIFASFRELF